MPSFQKHELDQLTAAIDALIASIQIAIQHHVPTPSEPSWNTPQPWKTVVLPNLESYRVSWLKAMNEYHASGAIEKLVSAAGNFSGLGKKIDFSTRWMATEDQQRVEQAIDSAGESAYRIYK